jgi:hypothetical protein
MKTRLTDEPLIDGAFIAITSSVLPNEVAAIISRWDCCRRRTQTCSAKLVAR